MQSATVTWTELNGGVTAPEGFQAAAVVAGLKASGRSDLSLLVAPQGAACAGTFTRSCVRAACVDLCAQRLLSHGDQIRAVLTNSGQANACTGDHGLRDSLRATQSVAERLGVDPAQVLICSTGVIGVPIPMDGLLGGIDPLVQALNSEGGPAAAEAILTTDLVTKQIALEGTIAGRPVRIGGMAKGSGMIHPDMATMLGYLTCDAGVPLDAWRQMVSRAVERSFNAITVDGDTSTNDSFLAFAAGPDLQQEHWPALEDGVTRVAQHLARAIARDGEGASCLIEVSVRGTRHEAEALKMARTVCGSSLVKTAIHGRDPNWGRIVAAAGRSGIPFDLGDVALWLGSHQLMQAGQPLDFDREAASAELLACAQGTYLKNDCVRIDLVVGDGPASAKAWGCDLSDQYVRINADYTT